MNGQSLSDCVTPSRVPVGDQTVGVALGSNRGIRPVDTHVFFSHSKKQHSLCVTA